MPHSNKEKIDVEKRKEADRKAIARIREGMEKLKTRLKFIDKADSKSPQCGDN